ncbi:FAD-dependent oxidoreductase [Paraburkholderia solisilvae]|uniref:Epoxidase LasC n=1 Tax=Paraburkholderia solisilvae TaxID=624376 RepID=A0A6J5ENG0_9BURK|nr:FAD-dependent oxidoreductase [Paraburkholderia solisilvae]CAB3766766.1 Putative epoxidase LasC [Paraburkholderia solisilvae]
MTIGKQAVVIGAGIGGLAAAQALIGSFERIVLLERDHASGAVEPRAGVPQGRHAHALLPGGAKALDALFDGFSTALRDAGARYSDLGLKMQFEFSAQDSVPEGALGIPLLKCTRPLIESVLLRFLNQRKEIAILDGRRVTGIVATPDGQSVAAVRCETRDGMHETHDADLVVDASGRGKPTLDFLQATGRSAPEETAFRIDFSYTTAIIEFADGERPEFDVLRTMPAPPHNPRQGLLLAREDNCYFASVGSRGADVPPGDWPGFIEFAAGLQTRSLHDLFKRARLHGKLVQYAFPENRRRHFERCENWPRGLIPFADAICRFNPIYGQGMSAAAVEAERLRDVLASRRDGQHAGHPLDGLFEAFMQKTLPALDNIWMLAVMPDFAFPETQGARPDKFEESLKFNGMLQRAACIDVDIRKLLFEVMALLKPSTELRTEAVVEKVKRLCAEFDAAKTSLEA